MTFMVDTSGSSDVTLRNNTGGIRQESTSSAAGRGVLMLWVAVGSTSSGYWLC